MLWHQDGSAYQRRNFGARGRQHEPDINCLAPTPSHPLDIKISISIRSRGFHTLPPSTQLYPDQIGGTRDPAILVVLSESNSRTMELNKALYLNIGANMDHVQNFLMPMNIRASAPWIFEPDCTPTGNREFCCMT